MGILVSEIRIDGFRGLKDFKMDLEGTTLLTGVNNVGKTSVLKALQLALGSRSFLSYEDLNTHNGHTGNQILVDLKLSALDDEGRLSDAFDDIWEIELKEENIRFTDEGFAYVPLRFKFVYDEARKDFTREVRTLVSWNVPGTSWLNISSNIASVSLDSLPFYYIDAKRDILDDIKNRNSFLGRMLASVKDSYDSEEIVKIEKLINKLNANAIKNSAVLQGILESLKGIDSALNKRNAKVDIMPFAKSLADLNKTVTIHYGTKEDSFPMDYHGMGTRSWSSLLIFKAFIEVQHNYAIANSKPFYPIIAVEEPESHLHPNAQKRLYGQIKSLPGQKIVSTHSSSVACSAELNEIRCLYKDKNEKTLCGKLNIPKGSDDERKIKMKVMTTRGELLFSKAIVLFEGETEEYLLPHLYYQYFKHDPYIDGVDMISIGGRAYGPFVTFANSFNIPWYIFSDGESDTITKVQTALRTALNNPTFNISTQKNIFILPNGDCIEKYLLSYSEMVNSIKTILKQIARKECPDSRAYTAKEAEINALKKADLVNVSTKKKNKTKFSVYFTQAIESSGKIPTLIKKLFQTIEKGL